MSRTISQINKNSDTFEVWVDKTNELLNSLATEIITANDATANTGTVAQPRRAQLLGKFGANTLVATNELRGGNVGDLGSALLTITSNTFIGGNSTANASFVNCHANVWINNANTQVNAQIVTVTGNSYIKGNTSVVAITVLGNTTVTNTIIIGTDLFVRTTNTSINSITIVTGNTFVKANDSITLLQMRGNGTTANTIMGGNLVQITANVDVTGTNHTVAGNVNFDTGTLFVDAVGNKVGIGTIAPDANLHVVGTANVSGATRLANTLNVIGATSLGNTLSVVNTATLSNTLLVTGAVTLSNTLSATGAVTFGNTLSVTNTATLSNTLLVTGAVTLSNTLSATGAVTFANTASVTGAVTFGNTLSVTNTTTLSNTLVVTGAATLSNTLSATGAVTFANTLVVTGNVRFSNTLAVIGNVSFSNVLTVTGNSFLTGIVSYGNSESYFIDHALRTFSNSNLGTNISTPVNIFTFNKSAYSSAKMTVQVKGLTGNTQTSEMVLAHNGTDSYITVFATVASPATEDLGDFSTAINGTDVELKLKQNYVSSATKVIATLIK